MKISLEAQIAALFLFKSIIESEEDLTPADEERYMKIGVYIDPAANKQTAFKDRDIYLTIRKLYGSNIKELNHGFRQRFDAAKKESVDKQMIQQALHYLSVYFQNGDMTSSDPIDNSIVYVPVDDFNQEKTRSIPITIIHAITAEEMTHRVYALAKSGVALSSKSVQAINDLLPYLTHPLPLYISNNKELTTILYQYYYTVPKDPVEFLRFVLYKNTKETVLIKSSETLRMFHKHILDDPDIFDDYIDQYGIDGVVHTFFRYKKFWLAFKKCSSSACATINKARKLAESGYRPYQMKSLEHVTTAPLEYIEEELEHVTFFKKVSIMNSLLLRAHKPDAMIYRIRNGKVFVKENKKHKTVKEDVSLVVLKSICQDLAKQVAGKTFYIPENIEYAVPTSEKAFFGPVPYDTRVKLEKNAICGIHWTNQLTKEGLENRIDLDLHYTDKKDHVGFYEQNNEKIVFSGDMTNAPADKGGATEAMYLSKYLKDSFGVFAVNNYTFEPCNSNEKESTVPYSFFLGSATKEADDHDYLIGSHEILDNIHTELTRSQETIGYVLSDENGDKSFYFSKGTSSKSRVTRKHDLNDLMLSAEYSRVSSILKFNDILPACGATIVTEPQEGAIDLSLPALTKDTFIKLLTR